MDKPLIFLFPGIGDHSALLGTSLIEIPEYNAIIMDGFSYLKAHHDIDLFWTLDSQPNSGMASTATSFAARLKQARSQNTIATQEPINQTVNAHPFLFLHQYALVKLLESKGFSAHTCVGYSLGEYTAATCSGAMTLYKALDLIARRAKLVDDLPRAAMLAVAANSEDIGVSLPREVSIAAVNSPLQTIVAGPKASVERLQKSLEGRQIICQQVAADHGFHTKMMNPIKPELASWLANNFNDNDRIPLTKNWLSSINQTEVMKGQHFNHEYWLTQLTRPVTFSDTVKHLALKNLTLVEIGPGRSLSLLAKQNPAFPQAHWTKLHTLLPSLHENEDHKAYVCSKMSQIDQGRTRTAERDAL